MHDTRLNAVLQLINPDNTLAINRPLAHALGICETIIYSTLVSKYLYYDANEMLIDDEWFYCTSYDLQESTTYGEKAQKSAIKTLISKGLIETALMGLPAKRYFKIVAAPDHLENLIADGNEKAQQIKDIAKAKNAEKSNRRLQKKNQEQGEGEERTEGEESVEEASKKGGKPNVYACTRLGAGTSDSREDGTSGSSYSKDKKSGGTCTSPGVGTRDIPESGTSDSREDGTNKHNIYKHNIYNHNINQSIYQSQKNEDSGSNDGRIEGETISNVTLSRIKKTIADNISLEELKECAAQANRPAEELKMLDEVYNLICDVVAFRRQSVSVNGTQIPWEYVKEQFFKLDKHMIADVLTNVVNRELGVANMRGYLIAALYNATMSGTVAAEAEFADEYMRRLRGQPYDI